MHIVVRLHTVFFRLVLAYACVFEVLTARCADKPEFCQGATEELVRQDAKSIPPRKRQSFPSYRYLPRHGELSTLHMSAWAPKSPPAEDNQPKY